MVRKHGLVLLHVIMLPRKRNIEIPLPPHPIPLIPVLISLEIPDKTIISRLIIVDVPLRFCDTRISTNAHGNGTTDTRPKGYFVHCSGASSSPSATSYTGCSATTAKIMHRHRHLFSPKSQFCAQASHSSLHPHSVFN